MKASRMKPIKLLISVLLIAALLCSLCACGKKNDTPVDDKIDYASVVDLKINPEFKLYLDEEQHIVFVEAVNQDAKDVLQNLNNVTMEGLSISEGMSYILEESIDKGYLVDGKTVSVTVLEVKEEHAPFASMILENVEFVCRDILSVHNIKADVTLDEDNYILIQDAETNTDDPKNQPCENCGGSGEVSCPECNGTGSRTDSCSRCGGSGNLPEERITQNCGECDGKGVHWVTPADDDVGPGKNDGPVTDINRNGGYMDTCDVCGGSGKTVHVDPARQCPDCNGTGTLTESCHRCSGTGREDCPNC